MGRAKGVHHINIAKGGQICGQFIGIFLFALEEADIFNQHDLAGSGLGILGPCNQPDIPAQQFAKVRRNRLQGEFFFIFPFRWAAKMGKKHHARALVQSRPYCRQGRADAFVVGYLAILHGDVKIFTNNHNLVFAIHILQFPDRHEEAPFK